MQKEKNENKMLADEELNLVAGGNSYKDGSNGHLGVSSIYMGAVQNRNIETNNGEGLKLQYMDDADSADLNPV